MRCSGLCLGLRKGLGGALRCCGGRRAAQSERCCMGLLGAVAVCRGSWALVVAVAPCWVAEGAVVVRRGSWALVVAPCRVLVEVVVGVVCWGLRSSSCS